MNDTKPKLLKSRQMHSRIFAAAAVLTLCVVAPDRPEDDTGRMLMIWGGYFLVILGVLGRIYCSAFIGGRKNKQVIRSGPFSVVRNPLYVFSFIATLGIGMQSGMWTLFILLAASYAFYYPLVVTREEAFLKHKFDASYETYLREVPRWIPNFKLWQEPVEVPCHPENIRDTMRDGIAFFLPFPLFVLIAHLQAQGVLPVWIMLP